MNQRKRNVTEEGLARQMKHYRGIFTYGPEHPKIVKRGVGLPQYVDTLIFKSVKMGEIVHMKPIGVFQSVA